MFNFVLKADVRRVDVNYHLAAAYNLITIKNSKTRPVNNIR
ncbi:MAG: hypothetical protein ACOCQW_05495 [Halanaerobiaceae bacterium]